MNPLWGFCCLCNHITGTDLLKNYWNSVGKMKYIRRPFVFFLLKAVVDDKEHHHLKWVSSLLFPLLASQWKYSWYMIQTDWRQTDQTFSSPTDILHSRKSCTSFILSVRWSSFSTSSLTSSFSKPSFFSRVISHLVIRLFPHVGKHEMLRLDGDEMSVLKRTEEWREMPWREERNK